MAPFCFQVCLKFKCSTACSFSIAMTYLAYVHSNLYAQSWPPADGFIIKELSCFACGAEEQLLDD